MAIFSPNTECMLTVFDYVLYFIPEINLFEDRFTENDHKALLDTLRFVHRSPWTSLFHTETFLNYRLQSENLHWMGLSASKLSFFFR